MTNFIGHSRSLVVLLAILGAVQSTLCHADDLPHDPDAALHATDTVSTAHEAAYRLADPIPNVISLPVQLNYDRGYGKDGKGRRFTGKVQPVIPITLSEKYVYYVRTVVPYEWKSDGDGYDVDGFGVPLIETFLSTTIGERNEFRIGPFLSPPAISGSRFGTQQTGGGVSWLGIMRPDDWAIGLLGYQSFAIGGSDAGGTATSTYLQPFISYITKDAWTYSVNLESTTSWNPTSTSLPLNLTINKAIMLGDLPISFAVGGRYYLASSEDGASGFGGRAQITVVLPRWS